MIVTVVQMHSTPNVEANIKTAHELMARAVRDHRSDWILLPEQFQWAGGADSDKHLSAEVLGEGPAYIMCRDFARAHKIFVHAGSIFEHILGDERIYNTSVAFNRDGDELARYRKIHLFDITGPDGTGFCESDAVTSGDEVVVYEADGLKVGCAICYDLRFPELFQALAKKGAQLIALPAAFTQLTGQAHWEPLIRARAIETQTYIAAAGSCGENEQGVAGRRTYGHSMLVDSWGQVADVLPDGEGFVSCELDLHLLQRVRRDMPLAGHRRRALYGEWLRDE